MTIDSLMKDRAALDAQIEATPIDQSIDETHERRSAVEELDAQYRRCAISNCSFACWRRVRVVVLTSRSRWRG